MIFRASPRLFFCASNAASTPANALLVLEKEQNTLVIVDPATLTIVARVPVGSDPHEVAVSDDGKTAYISNYSNGNSISVVDLVAQKALAPIDLGALRQPHGLEFDGGKVYFTAEGAKVVGRYDPATQKIDWVIGTGQNRTHMVTVSKDLKTAFTEREFGDHQHPGKVRHRAGLRRVAAVPARRFAVRGPADARAVRRCAGRRWTGTLPTSRWATVRRARPDA